MGDFKAKKSKVPFPLYNKNLMALEKSQKNLKTNWYNWV